MLANYLKITWKVLGRNRFFTFVSLFGISFTLMILMVLTSFLDHLLGAHYPELNRGKCLYIGVVQKQDSMLSSTNTGPPNLLFIQNYIQPLKTPEKLAFASFFSSANVYAQGRRFKLNYKLCTATFWEITRFEFLEGKSFSQQDEDEANPVAVISDEARQNYFGPDATAVGQFIELEAKRYRVLGVVKDVPITRIFSSSDIYLPYTVKKDEMLTEAGGSNFMVALLAKSKKDFPAIQAEYQDVLRRIPRPQTERDGFKWYHIESGAYTYIENFLDSAFGGGDNAGNVFFTVVAIFMVLFMSLPAINLVNLNASRILERASEVGVRKAFGASARTLVGQFLVENLVITFIGGLIALGLTALSLKILNDSNLIPNSDLQINWPVLAASIGMCIVFGLLSGVVPAWRMSKMHVVQALKQ